MSSPAFTPMGVEIHAIDRGAKDALATYRGELEKVTQAHIGLRESSKKAEINMKELSKAAFGFSLSVISTLHASSRFTHGIQEIEKRKVALSAAGNRLNSLEQRYQKLLESGTATQEQVALAYNRIQTAQASLINKQNDLKISQDDLNQTYIQFGASIIPSVIFGYDALRRATEGVTLASVGQRIAGLFLVKTHALQSGAVATLSAATVSNTIANIQNAASMHGMAAAARLLWASLNPLLLPLAIGGTLVGLFATNTFGMRDTLMGTSSAASNFAGTLGTLNPEMDELNELMGEASKKNESWLVTWRDLDDGVRPYADLLSALNDKTKELIENTNKWADANNNVMNSLYGGQGGGSGGTTPGGGAGAGPRLANVIAASLGLRMRAGTPVATGAGLVDVSKSQSLLSSIANQAMQEMYRNNPLMAPPAIASEDMIFRQIAASKALEQSQRKVNEYLFSTANFEQNVLNLQTHIAHIKKDIVNLDKEKQDLVKEEVRNLERALAVEIARERSKQRAKDHDKERNQSQAEYNRLIEELKKKLQTLFFNPQAFNEARNTFKRFESISKAIKEDGIFFFPNTNIPFAGVINHALNTYTIQNGAMGALVALFDFQAALIENNQLGTPEGQALFNDAQRLINQHLNAANVAGTFKPALIGGFADAVAADALTRSLGFRNVSSALRNLPTFGQRDYDRGTFAQDMGRISGASRAGTGRRSGSARARRGGGRHGTNRSKSLMDLVTPELRLALGLGISWQSASGGVASARMAQAERAGREIMELLVSEGISIPSPYTWLAGRGNIYGMRIENQNYGQEIQNAIAEAQRRRAERERNMILDGLNSRADRERRFKAWVDIHGVESVMGSGGTALSYDTLLPLLDEAIMRVMNRENYDRYWEIAGVMKPR